MYLLSRKSLLTAFVISISLYFIASAHAVVLVSESFDYPAGSIQGKSGGTGFIGNWQVGGSYSVTPGSLAIPGYTGVGNSLQFSSNYYTSQSVSRNLTTTYGASNSDLWASFMINVSNLNAYAGVNFTPAGQAFGGLFVGILGGPDGMGPPSSTWGMDTAGGSGTTYSNIPVVYGKTNLLVIHMTTTAVGMDRLDLYVNPPETLPSKPNLSKIMYDWSFNSIAIGTDNGTGKFDEIRLGTTYADVRLVPEPSCCVLLAIGGAMMLLRMKRHFRKRGI